MHRYDGYRIIALAVLMGLLHLLAQAQGVQPPAAADAGSSASTAAPATAVRPLVALGPGDEVSMHVFGQPNMDGVMYVADDGTIQVPLAGPVQIGGLSLAQAGRKVEAALKQGQFLVNPHVTFTIVQLRSQQVSVLGQVQRPGIYPVESSTTLLDLLAQAGGETASGADRIYILRKGAGQSMQRLSVNLRGLAQAGAAPQAAEVTLQAGDQVYVPQAPEFYVIGQVHAPGRFRLDPGMTVLQAIAGAGGVTDMGSDRRVTIRRRQPDGRYRDISARLTDEIEPNDIIRVKERIF